MNGRCPAEPSLISLYLWNCMGFPWCLFAVLLPGTVCCRVQTWCAQLLSWFEQVLLAEEVLPFSCEKEKRSGPAEPTSSLETDQMGTGLLFVSCCIPLMCVISHIHFSVHCNSCTSTKGREDWDGRGGNASLGSCND